MGRRWLNKVTGITKAKRAVSKATGIPTTRSGRQARMGRMFGCSVLWLALLLCGLVTCVLTVSG